MTLSVSILRCGHVKSAAVCVCVRVCVCAPARMNGGGALSFRCLHWHGVTVRSPKETSEAAAVRRSQLPLVTLVGSNLEEINSEP